LPKSIISELKRRNVFKVGIAYLILAWLIVQVTSFAVPALLLPTWVNSLVFLLVIIGFPFALFFAWAFEITPEGVELESTIPAQASITSRTGRKLNFIIIGLLVIGMGYFIYESRFATGADETTALETPNVGAEDHAKGSIAVLPFVNMSSDPEQEYFSDGISEEILNVLAKIPKLHVTSRSSAFAFKGKEINISEVAQTLGVNNILEGSVRKAGKHIRITAQLIEAGSDKHLWSETYDKELTDIFAIQDEISSAIVTALKDKLGLNVMFATRDMSHVNLEAHNEYLRGRFFVEKRTEKDLERALQHFESAIEIETDYAPAWMGKAWASLFLSEYKYGNILHEVAMNNAQPAIEKALQLAPYLPEAHAIKGLLESYNDEPDKAIIHYQKAILLNPNYADAYHWYASVDPRNESELLKKALQLDPMSMSINYTYGHLLSHTNQFEQAAAIAQQMLELDRDNPRTYELLYVLSEEAGKIGDALFYQEKMVQLNPVNRSRFYVFSQFWHYGLHQQALELWRGSETYEAMKHFLNSEYDRAQRIGSEVYPRNEDDEFGSWMRATYEMASGNYADSIKFLNASKKFLGADWKALHLDKELFYLAPSYRMIGDTENLNPLLSKWKVNLAHLTDAGRTDLDIYYAMLALLEDNIESAIDYIQSSLSKDKSYFLGPEFAIYSFYEPLRAHPKWPSIIKESELRASKVREQYLKLADRDAILVAREYDSEQSVERVQIEVSTKILMDYVGVYVLTPDFSITVTLDSGSLYMESTGGFKFKLAPETPTVFFSLAQSAKFSFQKNDKGEVISFVEHVGRINQKYMKVR
jgi:TolB-like protein/cytochrome c-type biogenesis protein CcmH/NrfG